MFGRYARLKDENISLSKLCHEQAEQIENLKSELEITQQKANSARDEIHSMRMDNINRTRMSCEQSATIATQTVRIAKMQSELGALRQILADLTGKDVNELVEAHRKAVRLLAYEEVEVKNGVSKDSEG